ncbi:MAG TPA: hypothetical protein P5084_04355 [Paludibacter sp.]|nr:hypothetical protein [Paludibacter sp.]
MKYQINIYKKVEIRLDFDFFCGSSDYSERDGTNQKQSGIKPFGEEIRSLIIMLKLYVNELHFSIRLNEYNHFHQL